MAKVTMYMTPICPYCRMAKRLLSTKGADVTEINVMCDPTARAEMRDKAGGRNTVPQIWIGQSHVGGCNELYALDRNGELDALLAA